jgi:hypothetical protein
MMAKQLPKEVQWDVTGDQTGDGAHASDVALSTLADGEESLLSHDVVAHVSSCDVCALRLGGLALETHGVTNAVESVKPWLPAELLAPSAKRRATASQPIPLGAIFAALGLTAAGATPTVLALPHRLAELLLTLQHAAPAMSHGGIQVIQQGVGVAVMGACALLLVAAGVAVTRLLPRPTPS